MDRVQELTGILKDQHWGEVLWESRKKPRVGGTGLNPPWLTYLAANDRWPHNQADKLV